MIRIADIIAELMSVVKSLNQKEKNFLDLILHKLAVEENLLGERRDNGVGHGGAREASVVSPLTQGCVENLNIFCVTLITLILRKIQITLIVV